MSILVDVREPRLLAALAALGDDKATSSVQLDVGDVHVLGPDGRVVAVVERKTRADMVASVKDGRWAEQRHRLAPLPWCLAVEGRSCLRVAETQDDKIAWGCIVGAAFRDRVPVVFTGDVEGTAAFVHEVAARAAKLERDAPPACTHDQSLCRPVAAKRNHNVGPRQVLISALAAVPTVSTRIAEAIADGLGVADVAALVRRLADDPRALVALPGIGKARAARVVDAMLGPKDVAPAD